MHRLYLCWVLVHHLMRSFKAQHVIKDDWPEAMVNMETAPGPSEGNRQPDLPAKSRSLVSRLSQDGRDGGESTGSSLSLQEQANLKNGDCPRKVDGQEHTQTGLADRQWPEVEYPASTLLRWRWAEPMGFSRRLAWSRPRRGPGDLAVSIEKEGKKDRAVIVRPAEDGIGSGGSSRDVNFDTAQEAIDWLRMRAEASESSST
eukprot:TRINITY_DN7953_c0_g1_i1.p2 TRINITY_DN7953_c0_g1~~TRINITY_DN7953_c0_g1_i1.p2  ORF type:complete len:202 (+),score=36.89 TRINITY_DN7953_c0_g1_i1:72-677(+)